MASADDPEIVLAADDDLADVNDLPATASGSDGVDGVDDDPDTKALTAVDTLVQELLNPATADARYVQALHELATFLENLEIEYAATTGRCYGSFDDDMRDDYRVGLCLDALNNHESFLDTVLGRLMGTERENATDEQKRVQASTYRLMMTCSVGPHIYT